MSSHEESNFRPSESASDFAKGLSSIPHGDSIFSLSQARDMTENVSIFLLSDDLQKFHTRWQ